MLCLADGSGCQATVKCRIGVNDNDSYAELCRFIETVSRKSDVERERDIRASINLGAGIGKAPPEHAGAFRF